MRLAASARQAARDMDVNLELELYEPGGNIEKRMASDIRSVASSPSIDALIVTIPSKEVANAVRYAAELNMPVFGLNSGHNEVPLLIQEEALQFFTSMDERLGG